MIEAQQKIQVIFYSNFTDDNRRLEFDLFNGSVNQKLWASEWYCVRIAGLDINTFREELEMKSHATETQSTSAPEGETKHRDYLTPSSPRETTFVSPIRVQKAPDAAEFCNHLNRLLDGFFIQGKGALDILAHQISLLYHCERCPTKIYIEYINGKILDSHHNSELRKLLDCRLTEDWFKEFLPFRHCATHESLLIPNVPLIWNHLKGEYNQPEIILPDNPQTKPTTRFKNWEVSSHCQFILSKIQSLIVEIYETILVDAERANNKFPIPSN